MTFNEGLIWCSELVSYLKINKHFFFLNQVIPMSLFRLFTADEFSLLINGIGKISVEDWRKNTLVSYEVDYINNSLSTYTSNLNRIAFYTLSYWSFLILVVTQIVLFCSTRQATQKVLLTK